jgi:hypothetical protein
MVVGVVLLILAVPVVMLLLGFLGGLFFYFQGAH